MAFNLGVQAVDTESLPSPASPELVGTPKSICVPGLYFPDGNIVLQAGMMRFRVFRSIMAARSPVFKDVLSLPQPTQDGSEEKIDGCDVVRLLDDPEDVTYFLKAIFDSSFFEPPPSPTTLSAIAGILRVSTKYEVGYLRRRALKHLDTMYPATLSAFLNRQELRTTPQREGTAFYVASLGREFGLDWLMPAVLFSLCGAEVEDILKGVLWNEENQTEGQMGEVPQGQKEASSSARGRRKMIKLVKEDRVKCLRALRKIWVREKKDILGFLTMDKVTGCRMAEECWRKRMELLRTLDQTRDIIDVPYVMEDYWGWYDQSVCKICAQEGRKLYKEEMEKFWDALPEIFGFEEWHVLEELKHEEEYGEL